MRARLSSAAWGLVGVLVGGSIVSVATAREPVAELIIAREFGVVDGDGKLRARLWVDEVESHGPKLALYDDEGIDSLSLVVADGEPRNAALAFQTADRTLRALFGVGDGEPTIAFYDGKGEMRVTVGVVPHAMTGRGDLTGLALFDAQGRARGGIGMWADMPLIQLADGQGNMLFHAP